MLKRKHKLLTILAVCLLPGSQTFAQNFVLPDGEYMDTSSVQQKKCPKAYGYFYSVDGKYPQSSSTTLKEATAFLLKKNETYSNSGYITFRFMIDCEGIPMAKTEVLQTDERYIKYHFDKNLVNELFAFLKTMNKWKIAGSKEGQTYAYKAFITFKIKDGKVINIIP